MGGLCVWAGPGLRARPGRSAAGSSPPPDRQPLILGTGAAPGMVSIRTAPGNRPCGSTAGRAQPRGGAWPGQRAPPASDGAAAPASQQAVARRCINTIMRRAPKSTSSESCMPILAAFVVKWASYSTHTQPSGHAHTHNTPPHSDGQWAAATGSTAMCLMSLEYEGAA